MQTAGPAEAPLTDRFRAACAAALGLALAGCVSVGLDPREWTQEVRRLGLDPAEVANPLAYTDEMAEAARAAAGEGTDRERLQALQQFLFDQESFPFHYETGGTYGAEEAFRLRRGNCVSFTSLFIALGRSLDIPLQAAMIERGDTEREGDLVVVNNHMVAVLLQPDRVTLYDFARERNRPISGLSLVGDLELGAVHLNNRGAEKLRGGRIREAIADLEVAIRLAPELTAPHANLGVARRMAGDVEGALAVYRSALDVDAGDPAILNNLASLYRSLGRIDEASAALQAADLFGASPYFLITRGDLARSQGHLRKARRFYRQAHRRAPELAEPLVALARLELERERPRAARKALDRALERDPDNAGARRLEERLSGEGQPKR